MIYNIIFTFICIVLTLLIWLTLMLAVKFKAYFFEEETIIETLFLKGGKHKFTKEIYEESEDERLERISLENIENYKTNIAQKEVK